MRPPSPAAFGTGIAIPVPAWTRRYRSMSFRYPRFGNHGPGASAFPDGRSSEPISGMFAIRWAFGRLCGWDRGSKAQGSMKRDDGGACSLRAGKEYRHTSFCPLWDSHRSRIFPICQESRRSKAIGVTRRDGRNRVSIFRAAGSPSSALVRAECRSRRRPPNVQKS